VKGIDEHASIAKRQVPHESEEGGAKKPGKTKPGVFKIVEKDSSQPRRQGKRKGDELIREKENWELSRTAASISIAWNAQLRLRILPQRMRKERRENTKEEKREGGEKKKRKIMQTDFSAYK